MADLVQRLNTEGITHLVERVRAAVPSGGSVAVLGTAYKPDTDVIDESPGLLLAHSLASLGIPVKAYDPCAGDRTRAASDNDFSVVDSIEECILATDVIVITTPWKDFARLPELLSAVDGLRPIVIDCWDIIPSPSLASTTANA